jgi:hypothetical protein
MNICGCNSSINSFLCYWAPILNGDDEKKYSTRMHTYEQTRERERERETSLFDNCVLLHQLSCWRHSFSSREGSVWNRNFNRICFNHRRLFAFYVMVKKKFIIIFTLHQSERSILVCYTVLLIESQSQYIYINAYTIYSSRLHWSLLSYT